MLNVLKRTETMCEYVNCMSVFASDAVAVLSPLVVRPHWAEERRLRQWLTGGGQEIFTVQCDDGRFSVTVDQHTLQVFTLNIVMYENE